MAVRMQLGDATQQEPELGIGFSTFTQCPMVAFDVLHFCLKNIAHCAELWLSYFHGCLLLTFKVSEVLVSKSFDGLGVFQLMFKFSNTLLRT